MPPQLVLCSPGNRAHDFVHVGKHWAMSLALGVYKYVVLLGILLDLGVE